MTSDLFNSDHRVGAGLRDEWHRVRYCFVGERFPADDRSCIGPHKGGDPGAVWVHDNPVGFAMSVGMTELAAPTAG